jgi:prevent-host-death family protein
MVASIREAKSKLSKLLDLADRGEEVIITSHGKQRARLVPIRQHSGATFDMDKLRRLAKQASTGKRGPDSTQIISDLREDRI